MSTYANIHASVIIILRRDNQVLLFRRQNSGWADGSFTAPSGHIDAGELPTEAAIRELKEETGIVVSKGELELVHVDYVRDQVTGFYFAVENFEGEPENLEPEKATDFDWYDLDNLPSPIAGHGAEVLENMINGILFSEVE